MAKITLTKEEQAMLLLMGYQPHKTAGPCESTCTLSPHWCTTQENWALSDAVILRLLGKNDA